MAKWTRSRKSMGGNTIARRKRALNLLEQDLKTGLLRSGGERTDTPLSEKEQKRIMNEITNLKKKIV
jgi:hypothetical protein